MSFFQMKNYAEEFRSALTGHDIALQTKEDESAAQSAEEMDQNARG